MKTEKNQLFNLIQLLFQQVLSARWLNINGEEEFMGLGVSACATCDGFF